MFLRGFFLSKPQNIPWISRAARAGQRRDTSTAPSEAPEVNNVSNMEHILSKVVYKYQIITQCKSAVWQRNITTVFQLGN